MSGERIHLRCPYEDCGSSDAFSYNVGKMVGRCHSCGEGYPQKGNAPVFDWVAEEYPLKPLKGFDRGNSNVDDSDRYWDEVDEVLDLNDSDETTEEKEVVSTEYKSCRGINVSTMRDYNVLTGLDKDGKPVEHKYPYPTGGFKYRTFPKTFRSSGKVDSLFGMNLFGASSSKMGVTITEGELDALSAAQMLKSNYTNPVVSVPSATPSKSFWKANKDWLDSFPKIILSVDNDEAGNKLAERVREIFPEKTYRVNHGSFKDANDFLMSGKTNDYKNAWWAAKRVTPEGFTASPEEWNLKLTTETPYEYVPTPIKGLNEAIRGFVKGGITILKALPGTGKSSVFRYALHDMVVNKNIKCAALMMEEQDSTTIRGLLTYELGVNVNTREDAEGNGYPDDKLEEVITRVTKDDNFVAFKIDTKNAVQSTLEAIKNAIVLYGVEYIFIDHIQRLAYHTGVDTATGSLTTLGVEMAEIGKEYNVGIICISHVNGDGRTKYAASVEEEAIQVIEMSRDSNSDDPVLRNRTLLNVTKNRPFATCGQYGVLTYDYETTMVSEVTNEKVKPKQTKERDF